jgi:hypothetical protein
VSALNRMVRIAVLALIGAAVAGCCVLPPRGWGHGPHGREGYNQGGQGPGYAPGQGYPRPGPGDNRR